MNCNVEELKAKLHNNRAIAHFKLGKLMRTLIYIFFSFEVKGCQWQFSERCDNFECMPKKKFSKKCICLILAS